MTTILIMLGIIILIFVVWFISARIWNNKLDKETENNKKKPFKVTIYCDEDNSITEFYTTIEQLENTYYKNKYPNLINTITND